MFLQWEIVKLPTDKKETGKFDRSGLYTIEQNSGILQHVYGYNYAWDILENTEDNNTIGKSKLGYLPVMNHLGAPEVCGVQKLVKLSVYDALILNFVVTLTWPPICTPRLV